MLRSLKTPIASRLRPFIGKSRLYKPSANALRLMKPSDPTSQQFALTIQATLLVVHFEGRFM